MTKTNIENIIDDLIITVLNNAIVIDITDRKEIKDKFKIIEDKKEEVVRKLTALLLADKS